MSTSPHDVPGKLPLDNLPSRLSSFVGRDREIDELVGLLDGERLVTLVGAPGVGKTRLALQVASRTQTSLAAGAAFVDLAGLAEPGLVPRVIATTLGVHTAHDDLLLQSIAERLRQSPLLLVLDNCEHLIAACAHICERLLMLCPGLRLLATSREPLRCEGELVWRVPSLTMPPELAENRTERLVLEELEQFESVSLFVARARAVRGSFRLTDENAHDVATICRRLDGIALAVELAAARTALLSPAQIAARLDDHLRLLTGGARTALPRQRTLEATLGWSYQLLSLAEQSMLGRLSVFAGAWTLAAAEAVATSDLDDRDAPGVVETLGSLVDKSLVQVMDDTVGEPRYRLLEMVRQYAFERLTESGEATLIRDRHCDWFLSHVVKTEPLVYWAPPVAWLDELERDHDNLRAALDWCLLAPDFSSTTDPQLRDRGLRLVLALFWPWFDRDHISELRWWLESLIAVHPDAPSSVLARACLAGSLLAMHQRQLDREVELLDRGSRIAEIVGDGWAVAWATECAGHVARTQAQPERAEPVLRMALERFEGVGDRWGVAWSLRDLGSVAIYAGHLARACELLESSLAVSREIGDGYCESLALEYLGRAVHHLGDLDRALVLLEQARTIAQQLKYGQGTSRVEFALGRVVLDTGDLGRAAELFGRALAEHRVLGQQNGLAACLEGFARIALAVGEAPRSARMLGAASAILDAHGFKRQPIDVPWYESLVRDAQAALPGEAYDRAFREGSAQDFEDVERDMAAVQASVKARQLDNPVRAAAVSTSGPLTAREREVAASIALGLTNRQIAERLVVSRRTVDGHVASILGRLGFATRAQIAVWAAEHGLAAPDVSSASQA